MRIIGNIGAVWGAVGVTTLLGFAIFRLSRYTWEAFEAGLSAGQWAFTAVFCLFMAYSEGYRGFQLRFSPRTAARFRYLRDHPDLVRTLLAPVFSMGYFHANRKTRITAISLTLLIVGFVLTVGRFTQPWRGIIDAGVVLGLTWGVVTLMAWTVRVFREKDPTVSPEVPDAR